MARGVSKNPACNGQFSPSIKALTNPRRGNKMRRYLFILLAVGALCVPAFAQETGTVSGTITMDDGTDLPGVTVTASGDVLPQPRIVVSEGTGLYRFPFLPPGNYELTFEMDGMATQKYSLEVLLEKNTVVNVTMTSASVEDVIEVVAATESLDLTTPTIQSAISDQTIDALPVGQEYRDFLKLAPGVQYTEDTIRGPSAGGNGQDNVYKLDGVDVGLPLFGTLSTEPAAYDIEQVSFIRGGVKAVDFNRSGGSDHQLGHPLRHQRLARSGQLPIQGSSMTSDVTEESDETFDEDKDWLTLGIGGPCGRTSCSSTARTIARRSNRATRQRLWPVPTRKVSGTSSSAS